MDETCEQLLSGAAFAEDQHGGRELGDLVDEVDDVACRAAWSDDELAVILFGDLGAEAHDVAAQVLPFARVRDERPDAFGVEVFGNVVIGAMAHRLDGDVELLERRNDDDFDVGVVFLDDLEDVESADSRAGGRRAS